MGSKAMKKKLRDLKVGETFKHPYTGDLVTTTRVTDDTVYFAVGGMTWYLPLDGSKGDVSVQYVGSTGS